MTIYTVKFKYQGQDHEKICFGKPELVKFFDGQGQRANIISISESEMEMRTISKGEYFK